MHIFEIFTNWKYHQLDLLLYLFRLKTETNVNYLSSLQEAAVRVTGKAQSILVIKTALQGSRTEDK